VSPAAVDDVLVARAAALYGPVLLAVVAAALRRPARSVMVGAVLATLWNVAGVFLLHAGAAVVGWWSLVPGPGAVAGFPVELWLGWAVLWGAVAPLATRRIVVPTIALVALDLVAMPRMDAVVHLGDRWLVGEAVGVVAVLVPGLLLARWTATATRLTGRATLQFLGAGGLLVAVVPALVLHGTGGSWAPLWGRSRGELVLAALVAAAPVALGVQAVRAFALHGGGTPFPLDPPLRLVTVGPYAYLRNPLQAAAAAVVAIEGMLLASPAVVAAGVAGVVTGTVASWASEEPDLRGRFGSTWTAYRDTVRPWLPRWRPRPDPAEDAVVYVAGTCEQCSTVGAFIGRRHPVGLRVVAAETAPEPLTRATYRLGPEEVRGAVGVLRALEHVHLGWAAVSWIARLPLVASFVRLVADAAGAHERSVPWTADNGTGPGAAPIGPGSSRR
jgi:protein-S-isoprenylcysteine O-methyltransferase Ste14